MSRALVFPFTCSDVTLPFQDMTKPIPRALRDYSAASLPNGLTPTWASSTGAGTLTGASSTSGLLAQTEGGRRHVRFDGLTSASETRAMDQGFTYALWVRQPDAPSGARSIIGSPVAPSATLGTNSDGSGFQLYSSKALVNPGSASKGWHAILAVFNGANSVLNVDGVEVTGDIGTNGTGGYRLASSSGFTGTAVMDVRRFAVFNRAVTDAGERELILAQLTS